MAHIYNSQLGSALLIPLLTPANGRQQDAYTLYHQTRSSSYTFPSIGPALPALGHAIAGSTGTAISNLAIYPLDLIITRLQVQRSGSSSPSSPLSSYGGVLDAFIKIYEREGLAGFYTGVLQDTGKSIADSFLFFLFYNYIRGSRIKKHGEKTTTLPVLNELLVGMLAGAGSKFLTTPISNIVTRIQTSSMYMSANPSVSDIAQKIREEKGLQGFWSGYSASLVLTLNPSLTFFLYEFFKRSLLPRAKREDPGARVTFLMAAMSKAIASSITYPFSLAKARAQSSSSPPVDPASASSVKTEISSSQNLAEAEESAKKVKNVAKRSTVFHSILQIYKREGVTALYEGIWGEILKGFFSHGITMLVKESIHKLIISTYYLLLKALKKHPSPGEMAKSAGEKVEGVREVVGGRMSDAGQAVKLGAVSATEEVERVFEKGKSMAEGAAERVGVMGSNTVEVGKTAEDYASKEAGHLLWNAQEMLGGKIEDVGKWIKPEK